MSILLWGLEDRGRDYRTISSGVGVPRTGEGIHLRRRGEETKDS